MQTECIYSSPSLHPILSQNNSLHILDIPIYA
jgi:hypothetical protein